MAHMELVLRVFVASPGDVQEERTLLEAIVAELSKSVTPHIGVRLDLWKWETDAVPGVGESAQAVINQQVGDEYDIFIGILWKHFGTPTAVAGSGTEEEFDRALQRFRAQESKLAIMMYFKDAPAPMSHINPQELARVNAFREKLQGNGVLYRVYNDLSNFENLLRVHLSKQLQEWKQRLTPNAEAQVREEVALVAPEVIQERRVEDLGMLDLLEDSAEKQAVLLDVLTRMALAIEELGVRLSERTGEINAVTSTGVPDVRRIRQIVNRTVIDLNRFSRTIQEETPLLSDTMLFIVRTLANFLALGSQFTEGDDEAVDEGVATVRQLASTIGTSRNQTVEFRDVLKSWPSVAGNLNHARRTALDVLDKLIGEMTSAERALLDALSGFGNVSDHSEGTP